MKITTATLSSEQIFITVYVGSFYLFMNNIDYRGYAISCDNYNMNGDVQNCVALICFKVTYHYCLWGFIWLSSLYRFS
jgi:hypothetical protein